jgi:hypothetical protein
LFDLRALADIRGIHPKLTRQRNFSWTHNASTIRARYLLKQLLSFPSITVVSRARFFDDSVSAETASIHCSDGEVVGCWDPTTRRMNRGVKIRSLHTHCSNFRAFHRSLQYLARDSTATPCQRNRIDILLRRRSNRMVGLHHPNRKSAGTYATLRYQLQQLSCFPSIAVVFAREFAI